MMVRTTDIVVVTSIPDHASNYDRALTQQGFVVSVATSAASGLAMLRARCPTCAIIDVRLPDMPGWELCRQAKADPQLHGVSVIVLTPELSPEHAAESLRAGCHAWIARPSVAEDLVRAVRHVLEAEGSEPLSEFEALLGSVPCPSCASTDIRAAVRVSPTQYYKCLGCGCYWRHGTASEL